VGQVTERKAGQAVKGAVEAQTEVLEALLKEQQRTNQLLEWLGQRLQPASVPA